eukprot:CAMPEP_0195290200 /NCGR_PEP_ID=MMETSP0707-20130614/6162_1 /TAXON_ID=33640 /ORGANISM="Asterionellopsis glacialis, Strain CCMP134" /LENGTH=274 /DNA_ID=CAMNT_0040350295 /DNA_START=81 /DNA_END=905 /DNA_ORIENTATION=+
MKLSTAPTVNSWLMILVALGSTLQMTSGFVVPTETMATARTVSLSASSSSSETPDRQPWDAFRFVRQSSKFVNFPPFLGKNQNRVVVQPGDILWTPSSSSSSFGLAPLDDVVMGGASSSTFDNNTGMWKGTVTDANNGGFIGIRSTPSCEWDMKSCQGIQLKLKLLKTNSETTAQQQQRKQRFKFVVRDSTDFNGICWTTSIDVPTKKGMTTVKVPFQKQVPTLFAKTVPDQTFQSSNVVGLQFAYSKFEYDGDLNPNFTVGDMHLQILEMSAY